MVEPDVMVPEKKMTVADKKALEKVIEGDFKILAAEFDDAIQRAENEERAQIEAKYTEENGDVTAFLRELRQLKEDLTRQIEDKLREGRAKGIERDGSYRNQVAVHVPENFHNVSKKKDLDALDAKFRDIRFKARNQLQKRRLGTLRTLALTGLSQETAGDLLRNVPTAQEILEEAETEQPKVILQIGS